ncbi:MAG: hypothetical protein RLZZ417_2332 [Bacteroidota bacterium]|jgi:uncharacterized phosphosugar-binding protein
MFEYHEKVIEQVNHIVSVQENLIMQSAKWLADCIINDHIIHTFGTGHSHMIGLELFVRAGGLANVNAMLDTMVLTSEGARRSAEIERISGLSKIIFDQHKVTENDILIIISNSGRNAMPVEMAMIAKEKNIKSIAITSLEQSRKYPSRHPSGKKLYEIADLVLDNCVPSGDGLLDIGGNLTGAASTISGVFLINLIATEAMKIASSRGTKLPVFHSQNIDGFSNEELYEKYASRIKLL